MSFLSPYLGMLVNFAVVLVMGTVGALTFLASALVGVLSAATITYMSVTGSLVVILLGTNVLGITKVRTANMVPAIFVAIGVGALLKMIF